MRDHLLIVRIRSSDGFNASRESLRSTIEGGLTAWPQEDMRLVSISPIPADRTIRPRRAPVRRDYPLLSFMEKPNA